MTTTTATANLGEFSEPWMTKAAMRAHVPLPQATGKLTRVLGMLVEARLFEAAVGDMYTIHGRHGRFLAEVVALHGKHALLLPYGQLAGLEIGSELTPIGHRGEINVGESLLGRVIDALGEPLDGRPLPEHLLQVPLYRQPLSMLERQPLNRRLSMGVRCLDALIPCAVGQRMGIYAGPGVGKSTLIGMLARGTAAQVVVLALVGERGREVGHFVQDVLGEQGLQRAVVVAATSDKPASERLRAAFVATAIAEYFRDIGKDVLLFVDSLTRFCMAQREIGLAIGEPPTSKGYPPSAFGRLPSLLERVAPAKQGGSITAFYTVLMEGDDLTDPVVDATRALLDGHIVLSRKLALRGQFPAVDILQSLSRLEGELLNAEQWQATRKIRSWLAAAEEAKELLSLGAYKSGVDAQTDMALRMLPVIEKFLQQAITEQIPLTTTQTQLTALLKQAA